MENFVPRSSHTIYPCIDYNKIPSDFTELVGKQFGKLPVHSPSSHIRISLPTKIFVSSLQRKNARLPRTGIQSVSFRKNTRSYLYISIKYIGN
ncbi:hypothetical protein DERP_000776 [Dermatophagoides pteronyssinus]|uniref:Uncharacterized protein n=1 Tax=Dermatophagoides pteronyssinus TaxID=6956 RepID=A0ABQ8J1E1_DERPT|nr:hypothetical protein DERP_000776 [Dermatophagoides pteronyssinus]